MKITSTRVVKLINIFIKKEIRRIYKILLNTINSTLLVTLKMNTIIINYEVIDQFSLIKLNY